MERTVYAGLRRILKDASDLKMSFVCDFIFKTLEYVNMDFSERL